jgi:Leucine-rich repeat (LRR) protein
MNEIRITNYAEITSHIDESAISILESAQWQIEWIQFHSMESNVQDLKVLNEYFKRNKGTYLRSIEPDWLEYLPDLQMLNFTDFNSETLETIKDRKIRGLIFESEYHNKIDLSAVALFKETLEELRIAGNYKNVEETVKQLQKLHKLSMTSVNLKTLSFLENLKIDDFYYYGSRIKDWTDLANVTTIKRFYLKTNTNLDNLDFITDWTDLEELELWYCSGLLRFPNCENLKKLKKIYAYDCNKLSDIDELKKLKNVHIRANGKLMPNKFYEAE